MSNIFIGLKKTCLGVLDREERDKHNEIGLKEGGGIEMSIYSAPLRDARSLSLLCLLTSTVALKPHSISGASGFLRLILPAASTTAITARMP